MGNTWRCVIPASQVQGGCRGRLKATIRAPSWLYIDNKGHGLINGKKELSFDLPQQWNIGELEYAFKEDCLNYDLEIPDEEELNRMLRDAVKSFGNRAIVSREQQ
jgi:hypothetical protein